MRRGSERAEIGAARFIRWLGMATSKFYRWRERYGCVPEHNAWVPRDFWREDWEKLPVVSQVGSQFAGASAIRSGLGCGSFSARRFSFPESFPTRFYGTESENRRLTFN